jgi:hypothetical protein
MTDEDRDEQDEWLRHPRTRKLLEGYEARRWKQISMICATAATSSDPKMVSLAAHLKALDVEVVIHGGKRMQFGGKNEQGIGE